MMTSAMPMARRRSRVHTRNSWRKVAGEEAAAGACAAGDVVSSFSSRSGMLALSLVLITRPRHVSPPAALFLRASTIPRHSSTIPAMLPPVVFILPALNEAQAIAQVLDHLKVKIAALGLGAKILVVDNGSTDATSRVAAAHGAT